MTQFRQENCDTRIGVSMRIGERIRILRGELLQGEFAEKLGFHKNTIGRWERGESVPDADNLAKILDVYPWVDPAWLVCGGGEMKKEQKSDSSILQSEDNRSFLMDVSTIDYHLETDHYKEIPPTIRAIIYSKFYERRKSGNGWSLSVIASIISEFYKPSFSMHDYDIVKNISRLVDIKYKDLEPDTAKNRKYWEIFDEIDKRFCFSRHIAPNEVKKEIISWIDRQIEEAKEAR